MASFKALRPHRYFRLTSACCPLTRAPTLGLPTVPGTGTAVQKTAHGRVDNGAGRTGCRKSQELDGTGTVQRRQCTAVYGYNFTTCTYLNTAGSSTTTKHIVA